ncbi:UbiA family prenyltransferase [Phycisphaerales bacterium AB-hyl4]|uniref:UbiA family prenyltransferase n=1 Tax=Natronomicrosphaera hydrolytica TaxID=3242702 RepID=A0ABV4TZJ9_9BACT
MAEQADDKQNMKPIDPEHPPMRVWLEVTRLSNLPTVLSNVLVGLAMALEVYGRPIWGGYPRVEQDHVTLWRVLIHDGWPVLIAMAMFYCAGMVLNDVFDRAYDRERRPERPIPSGRLATRTAVIATVVFALIGMFVIARTGLWPTVFSAALLVSIVAYNALHRRWAWTVAFMGINRGGVYVVAAAVTAAAVAAAPVAVPMSAYWAAFGRIVLPFAIILALYTAAMTYLARRENDAEVGRRRLLAWALPVLAIAGMMSVVPTTVEMVALAAVVGLCVLLWLGRCAQQYSDGPPHTRPAVMGWLAGMCLIDAYFLSLMGRPAFAGVALVCFGATLLWQRRVTGT